MKKQIHAGLILVCSLTLGCRSIYYSTWEKMGRYKRDLLQAKVKDVRDGQKETSQKLKDALTRLQEFTGSSGGDLERTYRALQRDYDRSTEKAQSVRRRIQEMDRIANDLFKEWESEAKLISSDSLRRGSLDELKTTRVRYEDLYGATKRAEKSMEPVLTKFRDYVLFLKHSLNAQAIGALQGETTKIQIDISRLIDEMNTSIAQAESFIKSVPANR